MRNIFLFIFSILAICLIPQSHIFAESNSGFLNDSIWYSENDFEEGDTIQIHTAIWNSEDSKLDGNIEFLDGTTILGTRSFSIPPNTLQDIHINWKVTAGDHAIRTRIKDAFITSNGLIKDFVFEDKEQELPKITISKKVEHPLVTDDFAKSVSDKINDNLPSNIAEPVSTGIKSLDIFRINTSESIQSSLEKASKKIEELKKEESQASTQSTTTDNSKPSSSQVDSQSNNTVTKKPLAGTEKPIAYVELFLLTVVAFIFSHSVLFYALCVVILFVIIRFIYRKIRG